MQPRTLVSNRRAIAAMVGAIFWALLSIGAVAAEVPPGPPFPQPEIDRAVYDQAGILSPDAIAKAEATIDAIENRTGAEVVVYTQDSGSYGVSTEDTEARALALINQWGIGRKGINDGLVIFFDIDPSGEHGQVQLYAAPGFEAAYLSNSERQSIFENDMLPYLRDADFDGALGAALAKVDAATTPEHAASLEQARQLNAVLGLAGAPIVFLGLSGWAFFNWRRYGKDPVYLDDPSILMPSPPPDLTAASGAMVMDGGTSRRALTTAMLDLASRGLLTFREDKGLLSHKVGIEVDPARGDDTLEAQRARNARRPIGPAEDVALHKLRSLAPSDGYITPDALPKFGPDVTAFDKALETHVVDKGWFAERPSQVVARWIGHAAIAIVAGVVVLIIGWNVPISGLVLVGVAAIAGGVVILLFAQGMPAVTMPGAVIRAMLHAYKRTLQKTMAQARTMQQVVDEAGLAWLDTPDQAVVWGTALGLQNDIEHVLQRSLQDVSKGTAAAGIPYFPTWYTNSSGSSFASSMGTGSSGGSLFSDSAIPDLGGMMSAIGTIGNSPSSSGGGGGGGFGGGGGGGRWWRSRRRLLGPRRPDACPARWSGPEQLATGGQTLDRDRRPRARSPRHFGHRESLHLARDAVRRRPATTVLRVPERPRNPVRGRVVEIRLGLGHAGTQPIEGERKDRGAHLLAETLPLERPTQPRAGIHGPMHPEPSREDRLGADESLTLPNRQVEGPVIGLPGSPGTPVVLDESMFEVRARHRRPGDPEWHRVGRVDARLRDIDHGQDVRIGRQPKDEVLAPDPEPEQRPGGVERRRSGDGRFGAVRVVGVHGRPTVHSAHGCCRDDGRLLREAQRGRP